jgi:hypothetical protein
LNCHIDSFNAILSKLGITVGKQDIKSECAATIAKLSKKIVTMMVLVYQNISGLLIG